MNNIWKRHKLLIRHQVYIRVLPVVFGAVLAVGLFSWILFDRQATKAAIGYQQQEVSSLGEAMRHRLTLEALTVALDTAAKAAPTGTADRRCPLLERHHHHGVPDDLVAGCGAMIEATEPAGQMHRIHWRNRNDAAAMQVALRPWFQQNRYYFTSAFGPASWPGVRAPGTPIDLYDDDQRHIFVFPPISVPAADGAMRAEARTAGLDGHVLVPVLIRSKTAATHRILMMDLRVLLEEFWSDGTWCALSESGDVLLLSSRFVAAGLAQNPDAVASGRTNDRSAGLPGIDTDRSANLVSGGSEYWLLTSSEPVNLPWRLVAARPAGQLHDLRVSYFGAILVVALLALALATWSITRLMVGVTRRLQGLADNMAALAEGDYARRMPEDDSDEVGRLNTYFNQMAVNLDEAHRKVKDQAAHLRAALENMRLLDRAKDNFLVLISHEVRTPLTAIMGGVKYLKSQVEQLQQRDSELVQETNIAEIASIIESSGERLAGFMNDAMQMTSLQSAENKLSLTPTPVADLLEIGLCGIRERARQLEITVNNRFESGAEWSVLCDPEILKVALEKILDNAVTHNLTGGRISIREARSIPGEGDVSILPTTESVGRLMQQPSYQAWDGEDLRWRLIEIHNTGPAISPEQKQALFGKFELVGRIEHHKRGSGLSLPIAKSVVEQHGGRIFLHSDAETGTSIYLLLPTLRDVPAGVVKV